MLAGMTSLGASCSPSATRLPAGIVTTVAFIAYQQIENHVLNPVVMSRTVKINPATPVARRGRLARSGVIP
jgi:hypothetical protein